MTSHDTIRIRARPDNPGRPHRHDRTARIRDGRKRPLQFARKGSSAAIADNARLLYKSVMAPVCAAEISLRVLRRFAVARRAISGRGSERARA